MKIHHDQHVCRVLISRQHHTSNSRPWRSIGSFMYIGSAGPGPGGRADGRANGWAAGTILNDRTTIFIRFHKIQQKTMCFSVVSRPAEAQVPIFIDQSTIFENLRGSRQSRGFRQNGARTAACDPPTTRRGSG